MRREHWPKARIIARISIAVSTFVLVLSCCFFAFSLVAGSLVLFGHHGGWMIPWMAGITATWVTMTLEGRVIHPWVDKALDDLETCVRIMGLEHELNETVHEEEYDAAWEQEWDTD